MSDWTKEPWRTGNTYPSRILGPLGSGVVVANAAIPDDEDNPSDLEKANAARICACVNALAGFPDPEADVKAMKTENDLLRHENIQLHADVRALVEALERIRDRTLRDAEPPELRAQLADKSKLVCEQCEEEKS